MFENIALMYVLSVFLFMNIIFVISCKCNKDIYGNLNGYYLSGTRINIILLILISTSITTIPYQDELYGGQKQHLQTIVSDTPSPLKSIQVVIIVNIVRIKNFLWKKEFVGTGLTAIKIIIIKEHIIMKITVNHLIIDLNGIGY
ncbi:hypothetical protein U3516DRAFT_762130 [Neocallimastix sp. 'constans']